MQVMTTYFSEKGASQTDDTLRLAARRAQELGIDYVIVPTTSGATAVKAIQLLEGLQPIIVTHMTGFAKPGENQILPENRRKIEEVKVPLLTATHALSGVERGIRKKFDMIGHAVIIASALRMFGQGVKVAVEITLMAADAGLIPMDASVIALGGTGRGVDTALIIKPAHTNNVFDLHIEELICKPR